MSYKKNIFSAACFALSMLALLCCQAKKVKTTAVEPQEQSAFYTFHAVRDSIKNHTDFTLANVTVVNTKIKFNVDEARAKDPSYLKIEVMYGSKILKAFTEHPLYKRIEIFSESGQIESKLISLPQGDFVLRIPYFEAYKKIKITEVINFKEQQPTTLKNEK